MALDGKDDIPSALQSQFLRLDQKYPELFPDLRSAKTLLVGSDYSGESKDSEFLVFSFLVVTIESWSRWEVARKNVRSLYLSDRRRMSFKRMGDGQRAAALSPFLNAANSLNGLSISLALHKKGEPVFHDPPLDLTNEDFAAYRKWKPKVLRKAFFASHVLSLILGGLGTHMQNVLWFTDEDAIAPNDQRLTELTQLFRWISTSYLSFNMGHFRCGTTRCDNGDEQLEDFVAIPDLIAGSLSEQLLLPSVRDKLAGDNFWIYRPDMTDKTKSITEWFADVSSSLRKIFIVIEPSKIGSSNTISTHHFYDKA